MEERRKETTEIALIKQSMQNLENKFDDIKKSVDIFHLDNKEQHTKVFDLIEKIESKKADKEVVDEIRQDIRKVVWIIITAVVVAVLALIIKP